MIRSVFFDNKRITLTKNIKSSENIFTIIIGKNGTGKSRLLQLLCEKLLSKSKSNIKLTRIPSKIISISTTPFDKFPSETSAFRGYYYQGIKGIQNQEISKGYVSKFIGNFLLGVISKKTNDLSKALNYLGYEDEINISFRYIGGSKIESIFNKKIDESSEEHIIAKYELDDSLYTKLTSFFFMNKSPYKSNIAIRHNEYSEINKIIKINSFKKYLSKRYSDGETQINLSIINNDSKIKTLIDSIEDSSWIHKTRILKLKIKGNKLFFNKDIKLSTALINIIDSGLLKLDTISLKKTKSSEELEIEKASSGEQSVIMNILGISSVIKDNSLILIDEPEVCLHPEWQERYIQLLIDIFKSFKNCHFIITTHSPQIISNLSGKNCFITSIEDGFCRNAEEYINKSSDYQLATLFDTPGFKNEYLTRISLNLLAKIMTNKSIDTDDESTIIFLKSIKEKLAKNDPVLKLILSLEEMVNYYA
ncbi:ATP-binding protein [Proteus mirabilis]|uniref:ATP-binding protein n=2 Tax=Proteus mirabilis TaxID=584 RepID=UPI0021C03754|nr:ATP-binding protein [Proteus mirabilis]MCT9017704.1 ATP-binding protein [Proteus mirabilis]MDF7464832.1 ATP-binding protein [Proteus mirabilis]